MKTYKVNKLPTPFKLPYITVIIALIISHLLISTQPAKASCQPTPQTTKGPYYQPSSKLQNIAIGQKGQKITIRLSIKDKNCKPVKGTKVSIWHADSQGNYTFQAENKNVPLRGYQISDSKGKVQFNSILPSWYPGRATHIHILVEYQNNSYSTQYFFPQKYLDKIYQTHTYKLKGLETTPKSKDLIYTTLPNPTALDLTQQKNNFTAYFYLP